MTILTRDVACSFLFQQRKHNQSTPTVVSLPLAFSPTSRHAEKLLARQNFPRQEQGHPCGDPQRPSLPPQPQLRRDAPHLEGPLQRAHPGHGTQTDRANPKVAAVNQVHWQNLQAKNKKAAEASDKKTKKQRLTSTMLQRRVIKPGQGVTKRVMAVALGLKGKKAKSLPKDQLVAATLRQQDDPGLRKWFTSTATSKMIK